MPTTPTPLPKVRKTPIGELTPHPDNPRRGDIDAIANSLTAHGQYRPIVANTRTGHVLAGNHTLAAAQSLGWTHLQVAWVDVDDDQERRILLADNRTADLGTYDPDALIALLDTLNDTDLGIDGTGYTPSDMAELVSFYTNPNGDQGPKDWYTSNDQVPHYQIVGEQPAVTDLYDLTKTNELHEQIANTPDLPDDVAEFLTLAAHRHTVFNYRRIAEYYPHAPAHVQRLIEASALVIIDIDDAIRNGFTRFHEIIAEEQWAAETETGP